MDHTDRPASPLPDDESLVRLLAVLAVPTLLGVAHHVDHVVRGNHVGWPLVPEVTPFTYSLAIYPLVGVGLYLTLTERVGAGYWAVLLSGMAALLAAVHLGPWAVEPPADIVGPYADPTVGSLAFAVMLGLLVAVAACAGYALVVCQRGDR